MDYVDDLPQANNMALRVLDTPTCAREERIQREHAIMRQVKEINRLTTLRDANTLPAPSHISRLPPELVSEIFLTARSRASMRYVFCQICSTWRKIALSTPRLWTSISFELSSRKFDVQMSYLRALCERAGDLPLSIALWLDFGDITTSNQSPIKTLIPYASRVRDLSLSLSETGFQSLCELPVGSLPLLEHCNIEIQGQGGTFDQLGPITVLQSAHRLQRLNLEDLSLNDDNIFDPRLLRLPSQLVSLRLECTVAPFQLLDILGQCPNLEQLGPVTFNSDRSGRYADEVVLLPRLRALNFTMDEWNLEDTFFTHFNTPSLRKLELYFNEDLWPSSMFTSFLVRSSCPLERLYLQFTSMETVEFLECLRAVPSLVDLHIIYADYLNRWVLEALTFVPGSPGNLLPKLQTFVATRTINNADASTYESFTSMIESRWWPDAHDVDSHGRSSEVSRLTRAELSFEFRELPVDINVLGRIGKLREEGLNVQLSDWY